MGTNCPAESLRQPCRRSVTIIPTLGTVTREHDKAKCVTQRISGTAGPVLEPGFRPPDHAVRPEWLHDAKVEWKETGCQDGSLSFNLLRYKLIVNLERVPYLLWVSATHCKMEERDRWSPSPLPARCSGALGLWQ